MAEAIEIGGYIPGALGQLVALQTLEYRDSHGFGLVFETRAATEMADFLGNLDPARDLFLLARAGDRILGSVSIDGSKAPLARLRWFIVTSEARGRGLGWTLLDRAVTFCRERGFEGIYLTTIDRLDASAHLYERAGFTLTHAEAGDQWGNTTVEKRYELRFREA